MKAYEHPARGVTGRGFTLVELLAVMGVIVLLVGIVLPSLNRARDMARQATCATNVREIARAAVAFAQDGSQHRGADDRVGRLPMGADADTDNWGHMGDGNPRGMWLLLQRRFGNAGMFICPQVAGDRGDRPAVVSHPDEAAKDANFVAGPDEYTCSYSYISMIDDPNGVSADTTIDQAPPGLVIIGDLNPHCRQGVTDYNPDGQDAPRYRNSTSHGGRGQNLGRLDQSVGWVRYEEGSTPPEQDYVYGPAGGINPDTGQRNEVDDSFLLP